MQYFEVPSLGRHQSISLTKSATWIKFHAAALDDYDFCALPDASRYHLVAIWMLAARTKNRLPLDAAFLSARIGAHSTIDLDALLAGGFIALVRPEKTSGEGKILPEDFSDAHREREKEREKEKEKEGGEDFSDEEKGNDLPPPADRVTRQATPRGPTRNPGAINLHLPQIPAHLLTAENWKAWIDHRAELNKPLSQSEALHTIQNASKATGLGHDCNALLTLALGSDWLSFLFEKHLTTPADKPGGTNDEGSPADRVRAAIAAQGGDGIDDYLDAERVA